MELYGFKIKVVFLREKDDILAYSWHYTREKAVNHLRKIMDYHNLKGEVVESEVFELWLAEEIKKVVEKGKKFVLPDFNYRNRVLYEEIMKIPKGKTETYSKISKRAGIKFTEMLVALMRNPFQVLIPCHRLLTNKRTLFGFYPLGVEVKRKLLEIEGVWNAERGLR